MGQAARGKGGAETVLPSRPRSGNRVHPSPSDFDTREGDALLTAQLRHHPTYLRVGAGARQRSLRRSGRSPRSHGQHLETAWR